MPTLTVSRGIAARSATVWTILADFGKVDWIPGASGVQVEGDGPGMRRIIAGSGGTSIVETLISLKPEERALSYQITDNPLPVRRFVSTVTVSDANGSADESTVAWRIDYEPTGDDDAARGAIEGVYGMMAGWIEDYANAR